MTDINKHTVSIAIGTTMFARYADLPNTVSHAIAEFIDNALQSYRDNKERLLSINPDFKFKVTLSILNGMQMIIGPKPSKYQTMPAV